MLFVLFSAATLLSAATGYKILTRYPVPGAGDWLMLVYLAVLPSVVFAHLAKYAFQNEWAFFAVQAAALFVAVLTYVVTFELAVESADKEREQFLSALGAGEGIIA